MCGHALNKTVHERLDGMEQRKAESDNALLQASVRLGERLDMMEQRRAETDNALLQASVRLAERVRESARYSVIETQEAELLDPGLALAVWLYSHLPSRKAVVAGEHAEALLAPLAEAGYEICSMAPGAAWPEEASLALLDATGDIRGMRSTVVVTDLPNDLGRVATVLRGQGYFWHLVVYQQEAGGPGYYANSTYVIDHVKGRVLFFRDQGIFARAEAWCAALLNRTYFRPGTFSERRL
jgi:hypothetical protein